MPIRRWLGLALLAIFLAPILTLGTIGFIIFRPTHGPVEIEQRVEQRLTDNADRWGDPDWQAELANWLAGENVDVVLTERGAEVYRTSSNPLAGTSDTGSCSFPRITASWWRRSSETVRLLRSDASALSVPCRTLNRFTLPT